MSMVGISGWRRRQITLSGRMHSWADRGKQIRWNVVGAVGTVALEIYVDSTLSLKNLVY